MDELTFEWRSLTPTGATLHKAIAGDVATFCGMPTTRLPARAPVDLARKGWPLGACKRCRRCWHAAYIEREVRALVAAAGRIPGPGGE